MNGVQLVVVLILALVIGAWTGWRLRLCYLRNPFPRTSFDDVVWMPVVLEQGLVIACYVAVVLLQVLPV